MLAMSIHIAPELESELHDMTARQGTTPDAVISQLLAGWLEDQKDITVAEQVLAMTDKSQWRTLDELRAVVRGQGK